MKKLSAALIMFALTFAVGACGGAGGSTAGIGGTPTQQSYDIQVVSPPVDGAQINRAFSITLNFLEPGTANPRNVFASETLTASVVSGPGALTAGASATGNGSGSLTFNNLTLDTLGSYTLQFTGPNATGPGVTIAFNVGAQRDLRFSVLPTAALTGQTFSVTVETVDPGTGLPAAPVGTPALTISLNSGTGNLGGTLTQTLSAGTSLTFNTLTYDTTEAITLNVSGFGFPTATSTTFNVDTVVLAFTGVPSDILVFATFSLTVNLTSQLTSNPISPSPAVSGTISVASGGGALSGSATANSSGSTLTFTNLSYNQVGAATFTVTVAGSAPVTTSAITFGLDVQVTATGPTSVTPSTAWSPFEFRVVDGTGATWTGAVSNLAWEVLDSTSAQVQSNTAVFSGGIASVTPAAIGTVGAYTLNGSITTPNNDTASIGLTVTNLIFQNNPGPFVALKSVRVNNPYSDSVAFAAPTGTTGFALLSGNLPPGLSLNTTTGAITGTPTTANSYTFSVYADLGGGNAQAIRCALAVFSANETEIVNGQSFKNAGPYSTTGPVLETYSFTSTYDGITFPQGGTFNCRLQYYYPDFSSAPSPAPVYVHHRGRGFNMNDYDVLGAHLASYGIIFITIEDYQSFAEAPTGGSGQSPISTYDFGQPERGMLSASAFQEGVLEWVLAKNSQTGHVLENRVDEERIFTGGHSRGGGATHGSHVRSEPYTFNSTERDSVEFRGAIYFMAFDLRFFSTPISGTSTVYPVPTIQPRLPSLIIAAENDGDLFYPICDQLIDRADGPTTFATIYGGCHAYLSDNGTFDAAQATITRAQQQERIFDLVIGFIKRWSDLDLSLDGKLYNNEHAGSSEVGVTAWRNMSERVIVDDHQNGTNATNSLGGSNSLSTGTFNAATIYPNWGSFSTLNIRHNILTLNANTTATYSSTIPAANQDMSDTRRVMFRVGQVDATGLKGFDWVTVRVRLVDVQNDTATVTLFDRSNQNNTYLPDHPGSGSNVYDRFVDANVLLSTFTTANPSLTLSQLQRVELVFETATGNSRQLYFDDLRFE